MDHANCTGLSQRKDYVPKPRGILRSFSPRPSRGAMRDRHDRTLTIRKASRSWSGQAVSQGMGCVTTWLQDASWYEVMRPFPDECACHEDRVEAEASGMGVLTPTVLEGLDASPPAAARSPRKHYTHAKVRRARLGPEPAVSVHGPTTSRP